jgi:hypothetical protein
MVEVEKLGFSLEPFIMSPAKEGKLMTWADSTHEQGLSNGHQRSCTQPRVPTLPAKEG